MITTGVPAAVDRVYRPGVPTRWMVGVRVDPATDTARVDAGVRSGALVRAAAAPHLVELRHLGGALAQPPPEPGAPGRRDGEFCPYSGGVAGPAGVDGLRAALPRLQAGMAPRAPGGVCLDLLTGPASAEEVRSAFRPGDLSRLAAVERAVDPRDVFRTGHLAAALGG